MSSTKFDDFEDDVQSLFDSQQTDDAEKNISAKLERRRRIEDLEEERRLKDELEDI